MNSPRGYIWRNSAFVFMLENIHTG